MTRDSSQHRVRGTGRGDRGSAAVEFVGLVPVLLLCTMVLLQMGLVAWANVSAGQAATAAARAASLHRSGSQAARSSLPGSLEASSIDRAATPMGERWTVEVEVPSVLPGDWKVGRVRQTREMPNIPSIP